MNIADFVRGNYAYAKDTFPWLGKNVQTPSLKDGEVIADLHCHPAINDVEDFQATTSIMERHNVGIIAVTVHGLSDPREKDAAAVVDKLKRYHIFNDITDNGNSFQYVDARPFIGERRFTFLASYELSVCHLGIDGLLDVLVMMPDRTFAAEFAKRAQGDMFKETLNIARDHDAIVLLTHPYTIAPFDRKWYQLPFRAATPREKSVIRQEIAPLVDGVDCPASNALWMTTSNAWVKVDFCPSKVEGFDEERRCLYTSDAHSYTKGTRQEIGRGGIILSDVPLNGTGDQLREDLRTKIRKGQFETYLHYQPPLQWIRGVMFG